MVRHFSGLWGADPGSDLVRLAQSSIAASKYGALLSIPQHPVFNKQGLLRFDLCKPPELSNTEVSPVDYTLAELAEFLKQTFPEWRFDGLNNAQRSDELVLQIDNAHMRVDSGQHAPAPLNYYRYVLETRYWKKVILINWGNDDNPISNQLLATYPKLHKFEGSLLDAWKVLLHANNAVIGANILAQLLTFSSTQAKRIWVPQYVKRIDFDSNESREVFPIDVANYSTSMQWQSSSVQRKLLLEHPPSLILDNTRWKFTETERCRSFQFCQPCRDTGSAGKLWRKVIQQRFDVDSQEWDCPHGWKWGGKPSLILSLKKKLKIGTIIKKTTTAMGVKSCLDCIERGKKLDGDRR